MDPGLSVGGDTPLPDALLRSATVYEEAILHGAGALASKCAARGARVRADALARYVASGGSDAEIARLLLSAGATIPDFGTDEPESALVAAAQAGHGEVVGVLLDSITHSVGRRVAIYRTLRVATDTGHVPVAQAALRRGADLSVRNSALCDAAARGHAPVVALLLDHGADVHTPEIGNPMPDAPLALAAKGGHDAVVALLLDRGADVHAANGCIEDFPLVAAASHGRASTVRLLLARGASPRAGNSRFGDYPLCVAIEGGHFEVAAILRAAGSQIPLDVDHKMLVAYANCI